jgi:hypothetical protein
MWTGFIWLRIGTDGTLVNMQLPQNARNFLSSWPTIFFPNMQLPGVNGENCQAESVIMCRGSFTDYPSL